MSGQSVLAREKYCFDASSKTITFMNTDFSLGKIKQVTHLSSGNIIYCPQIQKLGTIVDNVLTLNYDTTSMNDFDELQILYDWEANYGKFWDESFGMKVNGGIDTRQMTLVCQGSGQTINQSGGTLTVALGTTPYAQTIIRSKIPFSRDIIATFIESRTQNHANNIIAYGLYDVIGDNLTAEAISATALKVSIPATNCRYYNIFKDFLSGTSGLEGMNGMTMICGGFNPVAGTTVAENVPITSATMDETEITLTFIVSGFTNGWIGTCTLYGWNYISFYHNATTVSNKYFTCQRNGYVSNVPFTSYATAQTASTTLTAFSIRKKSNEVFFSDSLAVSASTTTQRATRTIGIPAEETPLFLHAIYRNGSSIPTATTATLYGLRVQEKNESSVSMDDINLPVGTTGANSSSGAMPIQGSVSATVASTTLSSMSISATAGGVTSRHRLNGGTNTDNPTLVKGSAGTINGGSIRNIGTSTVFFKLYNKATSPTSADIPVYTIPIIANDKIDVNALTGTVGDRFATGISYRITGDYADNDATAITAGTVFVNINYV